MSLGSYQARKSPMREGGRPPPRSPEIKASKGGRASTQAATRVKPEQAPIAVPWTLTRPRYGESREEVGEGIDQSPPPVHRGIGRSMCAQNGTQHGRPGGARGEDRTRTEGKGRGALQESEGHIVPVKRGNARGGKVPWFSVLREEWTSRRLA
jgi:hypothetical protein